MAFLGHFSKIRVVGCGGSLIPARVCSGSVSNTKFFLSFFLLLGAPLRGYKIIPKIPEFLISFHSSMFWVAHFVATK